MNNIYFDIPNDLQKEFVEQFVTNNDDDHSKFDFLRKFIIHIEKDISSFNHLVLLENPLTNNEHRHFMKTLNEKCNEFLESRRKLPDNDSENKKILGFVFCYIGTGYEHGLFGYQRDFLESCENYQISARLNNAFGTYKLAQCYEKGKGVERDCEKALYFYRCAAKLGLTDALHVYGMLLAKGGLGSEVDEKTGLHFLSLASVQSDKMYPYAQFDIAKLYETAKEGLDVQVDEEYAYQIYLRGARLDDPNCQFKIARCYDKNELGVKKNPEKAAIWYLRAAEGGHIEAQIILSELYKMGFGTKIKRDLKAAYYWALEAGTRGCSNSLVNLGDFALFGTGIKSDILLALWWYMIASESGSEEGKIKYEETIKEVERLDDGPQIPKTCCGFFCCK